MIIASANIRKNIIVVANEQQQAEQLGKKKQQDTGTEKIDIYRHTHTHTHLCKHERNKLRSNKKESAFIRFIRREKRIALYRDRILYSSVQ